MGVNELFASHYEAVASLLNNQLLNLDKDKHGDTVRTMQEASRCLMEAAGWLLEQKK